MDWAVEKRAQLIRFGGLVGAMLTLANLVVGPDPFVDRVTMVLVSLVAAPFGYFGVRAVLGLQLKMHGMSQFVRQACNLCFYLFGCGTVFSIAIIIVNLGKLSPMAVTYWMPASFALGALDVYAKGIRQARNQAVAT